MPVNPMPGNTKRHSIAARLMGGRLVGFVVTNDRLPGPLDGLRFIPHYATCEAKQPKAKPATPPDPSLF